MTKRLAELQPFYFPVEGISTLTEYTNEQGNLIKTSPVSAGYGSKTLLLETIEILSRTQSRKHALMKKKQQTDGKWFKQPGCRLVRISCEENYNREQKNWMLDQLKDNLFGTSFLFRSTEDIDSAIEKKLYRQWKAILGEMVFLFHRAYDETWLRKNLQEEVWRVASLNRNTLFTVINCFSRPNGKHNRKEQFSPQIFRSVGKCTINIIKKTVSKNIKQSTCIKCLICSINTFTICGIEFTRCQCPFLFKE